MYYVVRVERLATGATWKGHAMIEWMGKPARVAALIALAVLFGAASHLARAQCGPGWLPNSSGLTGPFGPAYASVELPNGDLVVGGDFQFASGLTVNNIARFNGSAWSAMGLGVNGKVFALAVTPAGDLIASGGFTTAGGMPARSVARWDGTSWSPLGDGLPYQVYALSVLPSGRIVAGGGFPGNVAEWDGQAWSTLGNVGGFVSTLAVDSDGALVAGGSFPGGLARWDGSSWSTIGGGVNAGGFVSNIVPLSNGVLIVGGSFSSVGGVAASNIARWNGSAWSGAFGDGLPSRVYSLWASASGNVTYITAGSGGVFNGVFTGIVRWDGASWAPLGPPLSALVHDVRVLSTGDTLAVGEMLYSQNVSLGSVGLLQTGVWTSLGGLGPTGVNAAGISQIIPYGGTESNAAPRAIVAGTFTSMSGVAANNIVLWDGEWHPLGDGVNGAVSAVASMPNGDLVAGGFFQNAGGAPAANIARWDGSSWSALGSGTSGPVSAMVVMPNGDLIAGGSFTSAGGVAANRIARWNGEWHPLGSGVSGLNVNDLAVMPNGDLVAAGVFNAAGGVFARRIARWDGASWYPMGTPTSASPLIVMPNGDLIAGAQRWNGSAWILLDSALQSGIADLQIRPDGKLVAAGSFAQFGNVAVWDGTQWAPAFPAGGPNNFVNTVAFVRDDLTLIGGGFTAVQGLESPSPRFAVHSSSGSPWFVAQPEPQSAPAGGSASFVIRLAPAFRFAFQSSGSQNGWRLNGATLEPGTTANGTTVTLSSDSYIEQRLTLSNLSPLDAGTVSFAFATSCGIQVSAGPVALAVTPLPCPGDANADRAVSFLDITTVLASFGVVYSAGSTGPGDADANGAVNFLDVTTVLANFGTACP